MTALEEYQEHEERHEFLVTQQADLQSSIANTTQAIQEINRRSRRQFQEAFEAINGHFSTVFQKLFGGGECGMELLDPEDILECGIDVFAQPPGKRLQNIMLLSGGEKTLTVFALLVALFMFRPSRFCVLDEGGRAAGRTPTSAASPTSSTTSVNRPSSSLSLTTRRRWKRPTPCSE